MYHDTAFYPRDINPTDNAPQTNWQKKSNVLKKQGTLSETNYEIIQIIPLESNCPRSARLECFSSGPYRLFIASKDISYMGTIFCWAIFQKKVNLSK